MLRSAPADLDGAFFRSRHILRGVEFRVFVAAVRDEVAAKISIQLRARAGTPGAPETLTFSYMVGGEQDAPVELRIGDTLYRLDRDDLLAFARAIGGKG